MNAEQLIIASAEAAARVVGTKDYARMTQVALTLTGQQLERYVRQADRPGFIAPVDVEEGGKDRDGALLALPDRAVIAWTVGTFRPKNYEVEVPAAAIVSLERGERPPTRWARQREVLQITTADRTWSLVLPDVLDGGQSIVPWLQGMLRGAVEPVFERD
ncbi:hypothetical protein [Actinomycetospora aeridis]|uniref:Uncharacterized protein n=1 Tax=Actinomycetospora aeridis TaxID=3129231 RepID=A0ABU8N6B8_9PSEU